MTAAPLKSVLEYIDRLEKDLEKDDEWNALSEEHKKSFTSFVVPKYPFEDDVDVAFTLDNFPTKQLWNDADQSNRDMIIRDPMSIHLFLVAAVERLRRFCDKILRSFEKHVKNSTEDPRAMDLLRFYGTFYAVETPKPPRRSQAAVSDRSDSSSSAIGDVLHAEQIHHKMFTDENELSFQKFYRFEIGGKRDPNLTLDDQVGSFGLTEHKGALDTFLDEALKNLKHARSFLSQCEAPLEPLTQTVFVEFLKDLMTRMNEAFEESHIASAVVVSGMDSVDTDVKISADYMRSNWKKRKREYTGGSWKTTLKIQSDVAIIRGRSDQYKGQNVGKQQQKMFLNCIVNVEMKKWQLLAGKMNKSPLTQVAAESKARGIRNDESPKVLFSLLTDCAVLYSVYHEVPDSKYWISRSVNTAEEILLSICWLYLCSIGLVKTDVSEWRTEEDNDDDDEAQPDRGGEEKEPSSQLESVDESDEINRRGNDSPGPGHVGPEASDQDYDMGLPVFRFKDEDDDAEERGQWQTYFLMENYRKYGTPLPLTEATLSLHNRQCQDG